MKMIRPLYIFSVYFILCTAFTGFSAPRLTVDPRLLGLEQLASPMDSADFARYALIASGASDETIEALLSRLSDAAAELKNSLPSNADDRMKAEAALTILYAKYLSKYSEFQTRVDTAILTGEYNCVSSAILYYYFARSVGLNAEGVETPLHALCTVLIGGKKIDVETTNPYGFDPGLKKERGSKNEPEGAADAQKKYYIVPQTNYRNRNPIDERRLITLAYNNRISLLERKGDFEQAVGLAVDAYALQGYPAQKKDMSERFINYAVILSQKGRDIDGVDFIIEASKVWGDNPEYSQYASGAVGTVLNTLMSKQDYDGGFALLEKYSFRMEKSQYSSMFRALNLNYLAFMLETKGMEDSLPIIRETKPFLAKTDYENMLTHAWSTGGDKIAQTGKWLEASAVLDLGLQELPGNANLTTQRRIYRQNYAIEIHNKAGKAFNAGDKATARVIVENGLALVPESTILQNDLRNMK